MAALRVSVAFGGYNFRRYSRPWIARVAAWPVGENPVLAFGGWVGDESAGGEVEILASPGSVVRWGQKDLRKPAGSTAEWGIVQADGSIETVTAAVARRHFSASVSIAVREGA